MKEAGLPAPIPQSGSLWEARCAREPCSSRSREHELTMRAPVTQGPPSGGLIATSGCVVFLGIRAPKFVDFLLVPLNTTTRGEPSQKKRQARWGTGVA